MNPELPNLLNQSPLPLDARRQHREAARQANLLWMILWLPLILHQVSQWTVRPLVVGGMLSPSLVTPALLLVGLLTIRLPRTEILAGLRQVRVEFALLALIVFLAVLSLTNSHEPIRSFRVIFPCLLPMAMLCHFIVMRYVDRNSLRWVPRLIIGCALLFSVATLLASIALPPLQSFFYGSYRFRGFFENSIQHGISLAVIPPLILAELMTAKRRSYQALWIVVGVLVAYTQFRAGSKSAMAWSFGGALIFYTLVTLRSGNYRKIGLMAAGFAILGLILWQYGIQLAYLLNPTIGEKIESIITGGVSNYQSIESRKLLWQEAIYQGKQHWLVGSGAGETVRGIAHAHNLVLDYFKGVGIFGAISIALLCLTVISRSVVKGISVLRGRGDETDIRILACYVGSTIYVFCSQLSDCFGPTTIGFLWTVYLTGRLLERRPNESPNIPSLR